ncbi:MAG: hypothetical protein CMJ47_06320 [Planctomyces sp.]|nr:hypothetical protein [Planctomyces sp.]
MAFDGGIPVLDDFFKIHTGEVNAERRHLTVALYMPLAEEIPFEQALSQLDEDHRTRAKTGKIDLIAVAHGSAFGIQQTLVLYKDRQGYWVYGSEDGVELAVLMDGDGRRYLSGRKLDRKEAMRRWMAGFLNWNCESPGMYRLSYAFVGGRDQ